MLIGLALAVALNRPRRGVGVYRSAIYLPMVFSLAVTGLFWRVLYQPDGPINATLLAIGIDVHEHQWLADPRQRPGGDPGRGDLAAGRLHHGALPGRV